MPGDAIISSAVEGDLDEAVAKRLIIHSGGKPGIVYGRSGKSHLKKRAPAYNAAAQFAPWLVLVDLDQDEDCAPPLRQTWLPHPAQLLCFRIAVLEIEAWLMADASSLSNYMRVPLGQVPKTPETLPDPKLALVNLARRSRKSAIRSDMVPRDGSGRTVGPLYVSRMIEYVQGHWQIDVAQRNAESLRRAVAGVQRLLQSVKSK